MPENPYRSPEQPAASLAVAGKRGPPSKVVLVVAVVNFLLGTLGLLCSSVSIIRLVTLLSADASWARMGTNSAGGSFFFTITIVLTVLSCLFTGGILSAGVGLLYRKPWARFLTLAIAGLTCLFALLILLFGLIGMTRTSPMEFTAQILLGLGLQLYSVLVFSTLTREKYAAEFESTSAETTERPHE